MSKSRISHLLISFICAGGIGFASPAASAQEFQQQDVQQQDVQQQDSQPAETFANPSDEQMELNDDAVRAIVEGDYAAAVALLEEARSLGELNVTFLNLGRAYQKLGQCDNALEALDKALTAPRVRQPPPDFVIKKVAAYRAELDEQCAASQPVEAPPEVESEPNTTAWVLTGSGVAVMAGGGAMLALASSERDKIRSQPEPGEGLVTERTMREAQELEDRANLYDTIGVGALAGGAVLTGIGAYLFLSHDAEGAEPAGGPTVRLGADSLELQWRVLF